MMPLDSSKLAVYTTYKYELEPERYLERYYVLGNIL